jgi:hypothetical protein
MREIHLSILLERMFIRIDVVQLPSILNRAKGSLEIRALSDVGFAVDG